jgi:hypothetical protein
VIAAQLPHIFFGQPQQVLPVKEDFTGLNPSRRHDEAHDRIGGNTFAASGFADYGKSFTAFQREIDPVNGLERSMGEMKMGGEFAYLKKCRQSGDPDCALSETCIFIYSTIGQEGQILCTGRN